MLLLIKTVHYSLFFKFQFCADFDFTKESNDVCMYYRNMMRTPILLCLLWSLVEVHSQTEYPYVSFMGETLPNHSYVDLSIVDSGSDSIQCHTDLESCCTCTQGIHRGNWTPPGRERRLSSYEGEV